MSKGAQRVEGVPVRIVAAGGVRLAVLDVGAGPAVLLVPGYTGSKEDFGPLLAPLAAAGHRAVAVDLRGQLDSPGSGPAASYDPPGLAADLLALLDALDLGPAHVVGHSYGGLVVRAALLARPDAFASLTLLCSGPAAIGGQRSTLISRLRRDLHEGGTARIAALSRAVGGSTDFEDGRMRASDPTGLLGMGEALLVEPDRTDALAKVLADTGMPVLVACGEQDDAWSVDVQRAMAERLGAPFATVPHSGHSPVVEQPAATAELLLRFLAGA